MAKHTKRKPGEKRGRKEWVGVDLTIRHSINGINYGPGTVRVHPDTAAVLKEQEQRFKDTEAYLRQNGAAIIGAGNRVVPVRTEFFDEAVASMSAGIHVLGSER